MNYNLEQIDVLRQRAKVSYEEAKTALEINNGDMVAALIYLEKQNKVEQTCCADKREKGFISSIKKLFKKGQETRFVIFKKESVIINVPLNAAILTTVIMPKITIFWSLVALFTNHKIKLVKPDGNDMNINKVFDKMSTSVANISNEIVEK